MTVIERWHQIMVSGSLEELPDLLAPDCVFWSPVVHTPQRGRDITLMYLGAAQQVLNEDFHYVREVVSGDSAVLEFECVVDSIQINGIDMIRFDDDHIVDFKVMVRPLKAINKLHEKMMSMLDQMKASAS